MKCLNPFFFRAVVPTARVYISIILRILKMGLPKNSFITPGNMLLLRAHHQGMDQYWGNPPPRSECAEACPTPGHPAQSRQEDPVFQAWRLRSGPARGMPVHHPHSAKSARRDRRERAQVPTGCLGTRKQNIVPEWHAPSENDEPGKGDGGRLCRTQQASYAVLYDSYALRSPRRYSRRIRTLVRSDWRFPKGICPRLPLQLLSL